MSSTTGASASVTNVSSASVATAVSLPSLNSAAQTGTLEVASIATTRDILKVFLAMPFFVFLIFVMIIVPLGVVYRLFLGGVCVHKNYQKCRRWKIYELSDSIV